MKLINLFLLLIVVYSAHTFIETIAIENRLQKFKESANVEVYELGEEIDFTFKQNDILLNRKSGHDNLIIADIITFYTGGHSAVVTDVEGKKSLEVYGYSDYYNYVREYDNDWIQNEIEVIGMRTSEVELDFSLYLGQPYDWVPFIPNNWKYCTELITDTYKEAGVQIDYDYGIVTVNDIILGRNVEMFLYKEIKDGLVYIYWED